jgi:cytochrome c-type biogenesis protein CcmE
MRQTKVYYLIGAVLLLIFAGFSYSEFKDSLTPYVPFDVARKADRTVQVAGGLDKGTSSYDEESGILRFGLVDKKTQQIMRVRYDGLKPANFEDAVSIVAIGRYDKATQELAANKLLVKCPSKYQGLESVDMEKTLE